MKHTESAQSDAGGTAPAKHTHDVETHPRANELVDPVQYEQSGRSRRLRLGLAVLFGALTVALIAAAFITGVSWMMVVAIAGFALYMLFIMLPIVLASSAKITDDEKVGRAEQRS